MTSLSHSTFSDGNSGRVLPVLLAGGNNMHLWPLSRLNMPLQFQRNLHSASPFESMLAGLNNLHHALPPVITLPSSVLNIAKQQLAGAYSFQSAATVVEPVDRGTLSSAITAAFLAAKIDRDAVMLIVDCVHPTFDWMALDRITRQTLQSPYIGDNLIVCGHPTPKSEANGTLVQKAAKTTEPNLHAYEIAHTNHLEGGYEIGAITLATPRNFLKWAGEHHLATLNACSKALAGMGEREGVIWPDVNLWSAQPQLSLKSALEKSGDNVLLRPTDISGSGKIRTHQSRDVFETDNINCKISAEGHLTVVAGVEGVEVLSTADATLITQIGSRERAASLISRLNSYDRPELASFPTSFHTWGHQKEIDRGRGFTIQKLVIEPNCPLLSHYHEHRAEHWHVLSGHGEAKIGARKYALAAGFSIDIPRNVQHGCTNLAARPLVILETRHGSTLSDKDSHLVQEHSIVDYA